MNLLLLSQEEAKAPEVVLSGRRAMHIARVLRKSPGERLRAGVVDVGIGHATVKGVSSDKVVLCDVVLESTPRLPLRVVLALPRPKGLSRIVQTLASFGVSDLDLIGTWKVDRAYFDSPRLAPARLHEDVLLGLEQGATCHATQVRVHRRFRPFIEDELPRVPGFAESLRIVHHPSAAENTMMVVSRHGPKAIPIVALGPDGGFIDAELASFERAGFSPARLGSTILRTEVAVSAALAQLQLAREACLQHALAPENPPSTKENA